MEDSETDDSSDELEVVQMFRVDTRMRVDLQRVVVVGGVLEKAVEWVEHLVGKQEEELSRQTTIIETILTVKLDHQSLLQVGCRLSHNLSIGILEDGTTSYFDMALARQDSQCWLRTEVDKLPSEIPLVLGYSLIERRWQARVVPGGSLCVVVDEIDTSCVGQPHLPTARKWAQLGDWLLLNGCVVSGRVVAVHSYVLLSSGINPGGGSGVVVNIVGPAFRSMPLLPTCRQFSSTGCGSACSHHRD